jgi:hypothetical protein
VLSAITGPAANLAQEQSALSQITGASKAVGGGNIESAASMLGNAQFLRNVMPIARKLDEAGKSGKNLFDLIRERQNAQAMQPLPGMPNLSDMGWGW